MPQVINSNIASLTAQRNLNASQSSLNTSLERLSSGMRINSAKDDAAGLAISERMTSQISGLNQAARNANDGISLAQTAEGDLVQITNNLQRIRDLAVQSANATNSASDRATLQAEATALLNEVDRIASVSSFNGTKLLDGSFTSQQFQVGANATANDRINISTIASARTSQLGSAGTTTSATTTSSATTAALSAGDVTLNGFQVGASTSGAPGQSTSSAFSIANAINSIAADSGVTAIANSNNIAGGQATTFTAIAADTFSINGINIGAVAAGSTAAGQGANLATAINAVSNQSGVTAVANATTGALSLTAADGRDITIGLNGAAADPTTAATNKTNFLAQTGLTTGTVGQQGTALVAGTGIADAATIAASPFTGTTLAAGAIAANGVSVGAVTFGTEAFNAVTAPAASALGSTLTISGLTAGSTYTIGSTATNVGTVEFVATGNDTTDAQAFRTAYNALGTTQFSGAANVLTSSVGASTLAVTAVRTSAEVSAGVTASEASIASTAAISTANGAGFTLNAGTLGLQASGGAAYGGQQFAIAINNALETATGGAAQNGTVASDATTGVITYTDGASNAGSTLDITSLGTATDATAATANQTALAAATGLTTTQLGVQASAGLATENHGTVTLSSTNPAGIVIGGAATASAGLTTGQTTATTVSSVSAISALSLSSVAGANSAIEAIDGALSTVNSSRASLGAIQNRFASTVSSLQSTSENLSAARSRIRDADFAAETANMTRGQILQQAGVAILAQANSLPNNVLSLLR